MSEFLEGLQLNRATGNLLVISDCLTENLWTSCLYIVGKEELEEQHVWHRNQNISMGNFTNKSPFNFTTCDARWVDASSFVISTDCGHLMLLKMSDSKANSKVHEVFSRHEHDDEVTCLDAVYDSSFAITGSADATIKLWDLSEQLSTRTIEAYDQPISTISVSPKDKNLFLSCGEDQRNLLWDMRKETPAMILGNPLTGFVTASAWSQTNQNLIAMGSKFGQVGVFDIRHIQVKDHPSNLVQPNAHQRLVRSVRFNHNSKMLASCGEDAILQVISLDSPKDPKQIYKSKQMGDKLTGLEWNQDKIVSCSWDGSLALHALNVKS